MCLGFLFCGWEFLRMLHGGDWGRTVVVYDYVLGVLVSDPVALCVVGECDGLRFQTALFHAVCVGG